MCKFQVEDVRKEIDTTLAKMKSGKRWAKGGGASHELRELRKELRERERQAVRDILKGARVVLSTLTSATTGDGALKHLQTTEGVPFDVAVIDECSQSMEIACWIPLIQTKKVRHFIVGSF